MFAESEDEIQIEEEEDEEEAEIDLNLLWPEQNVDVEGPSTGKKLTDDLLDIKDKMHEMTWHLFDDKIYHLKNPDACFFGQAKRPEKQRRKADVAKELDKLMRVGPYSHPNPFVARVGLYVEPIVGSSYSFLCFFRAAFNVLTWRDPMLTFWLSFFCGLAAIILFVFPWRIFLFFLGILLVGPQNWAIRILREKGYLPPLPKPGDNKRQDEKSDDVLWPYGLPSDQPIFTPSDRQTGKPNVSSAPADPREVHHVVVPYSRLMYQRFYDWPPEPQYAQVKPDEFDDARRRLNKSALFAKQNRKLRFQQQEAESSTLRRRFNARRRAETAIGVGANPPPSLSSHARKRSNTGDWLPSNGH